MRRSHGTRRVAHAIACGALLVVLTSGCGQSVSGTPHAEGEGPSPSAAAPAPGASGEAAPPTSFSEPSGRPTVTVQPDETGGSPTAPSSSPIVPGPLPGSAVPAPTTGSPVPAPDQLSTPTASPAPGRPRTGSPGTGSPTTGSPGTGSPGTGSPGAGEPGAGPLPLPRPVEQPLLTADVVRDECLLDAAGFAALLGGPVGAPAENVVRRPDGSTARSCYALSRSGSPAPTGAINIYRVNRGTPAAFVRAAAGGRALDGIGEAAVLLDTVGGTTLQIATPKYLITVSVVDGAPPEDRWRAAGRAVADAAGRL